MTFDDYMAIAELQNFRCAICNTDVPGRGHKNFTVDHDHETGIVRGLLCWSCNAGIGLLKDNPKIVKAALDYLIQGRLVPSYAKASNAEQKRSNHVGKREDISA